MLPLSGEDRGLVSVIVAIIKFVTRLKKLLTARLMGLSKVPLNCNCNYFIIYLIECNFWASCSQYTESAGQKLRNALFQLKKISCNSKQFLEKLITE